MSRLSLFMMTSVDGFFEGPNHELDWHNVDTEFIAFAEQQLKEADILLFGRRTYEMMADYWPAEHAVKNDPVIANLMNSMPKIVFSRKMNKPEWTNTQLIKENIAGEITQLKKEKGKDLLILGSSNLTLNLMEAGLVDELRIMISPVVLGRGKSLFDGIKKMLRLKLLKTRSFDSGNVLLYYEPVS